MPYVVIFWAAVIWFVGFSAGWWELPGSRDFSDCLAERDYIYRTVLAEAIQEGEFRWAGFDSPYDYADSSAEAAFRRCSGL